MKICTKCGIEKPHTEFGKRSASKDGLMFHCKPCCAQAGKSYREQNREKECERQRKWARENPEKAHEKNKRWRMSNSEAQIQRAREWQIKNRERDAANKKEWRKSNPELTYLLRKRWFESNPEKRKAQAKSYRQRNPDKCRALYSARRARKVRAVPAWIEKMKIQAIYREARRLTMESGIPHHVDHIVPLRHPLVCGLHVVSNLQILTAEENMRKYNRFVVE